MLAHIGQSSGGSRGRRQSAPCQENSDGYENQGQPLHVPPSRSRNDFHASGQSGTTDIDDDRSASFSSGRKNDSLSPQKDFERYEKEKDDNDAHPPPLWRNSSAKRRIIEDLQDATSEIHLYVGQYSTNDFGQVNFARIHATYAKRYKLARFRENLKLLLRHALNKTGPFVEKEEQRTEAMPDAKQSPGKEGIEPWKSKSKRSKGWYLLYGLRMDQVTNAELDTMTLEEIWESNKHFKCYPLNKFKMYDIEMKKLTNKLRQCIDTEEEDFRLDCIHFPHNLQTDRGEPFWYNHRAKQLLKQDVEIGLSSEIAPGALWETREEYKEFSLRTFRKHVYQEQERQRAAPFWRHKRNIAAREKLTKERDAMKWQWTADRMDEQFQRSNIE